MNLKSTFAKIGALLLCSVILFSSFGFTINMHICQGKVKAINVLGEAPKCADMIESDVCNTNKDQSSYTKKKCCSESSLKSEITTKNIPNITKQSENLVLGVNPYAKLIAKLIFERESVSTRYIPPPDDLSGRELLLLHQTFLI